MRRNSFWQEQNESCYYKVLKYITWIMSLNLHNDIIILILQMRKRSHYFKNWPQKPAQDTLNISLIKLQTGRASWL